MGVSGPTVPCYHGVSEEDFSPAAVFKMAATMCERGSSTATNAMKTEVHLKSVVDSEEDIV
jgi:hypothetical protein